MGKASRWLRGLLGSKKSATSQDPPGGEPLKERRKWGFVKSFRDKERGGAGPRLSAPAAAEQRGSYREGASRFDESNKHAIAVAAATAAVAEAAVAAAQAAAAVVRLTSSGRAAGCSVAVAGAYGGGGGKREDWAAVKIQSAFRAYLARRALRALKGLVKLQALVRGHIVRKQAFETLRCMQALVRVQARARAGRLHASEAPHPPHSSQPSKPTFGPATPDKQESRMQRNLSKRERMVPLKRNASKPSSGDIGQDGMHPGWMWLDRWMDGGRSIDHAPSTETARSARTAKTTHDDDHSDKILEIDPGKPGLSPSKDSTTAQLSISSASPSVRMPLHSPLSPLRVRYEEEDCIYGTAENSPQLYSASSSIHGLKRGPFAPAKSEGSGVGQGYFDGYYWNFPNYMANTESSRAKARSQSAPRQRPECEKVGSLQKSEHGDGCKARFTSKAYPGSGRLNRLGMPIRG
ncbi:hypothetical protein AMTRI_Chr09g22790 [Amborella trichopoda]